MTNGEPPRAGPTLVLPASQGDMGLPADVSIIQTFHNVAAHRTVVEVRRPGAPPIHALYWKPAYGSSYSGIGHVGAGRSLENAVNCKAPFIFARVVEWTRQGTGYGGRTFQLVKVHLADDPCVEGITLDLLPTNARVSRLLRANDSGTQLDAIVLLMEPHEDGQGERVRRAICTLDIAGQTIVELETLHGLHF